MHAICGSVNQRVNPSHIGTGKFGDPKYDKTLIREARDELARLRRLSPPKADEGRLQEAFRHWSLALDDFERLAHATEKNDAAARRDSFDSLAAQVRRIARLIPDYPAGECLGEGLG